MSKGGEARSIRFRRVIHLSHVLEAGMPEWPAGTVRPRPVAWAELLRRTFGLDVLACPDCGGRLRR